MKEEWKKDLADCPDLRDRLLDGEPGIIDWQMYGAVKAEVTRRLLERTAENNKMLKAICEHLKIKLNA